MNTFRPKKVQAMVEATLNAPAETTPELRRAVEEWSAALNGGTAATNEIPAELKPYLRKVALSAYLIDDHDVELLKAAHYSENAIFELTVSAAVGASLGRLDRALEILKAGK